MSPVLAAALVDLSGNISPERIDQIWLFPPRQLGEKESTLAVLSLFDANGASERREVVTLHCEAEHVRGRTRRMDTLREEGSIPSDRIPKLIAGVLRRLGDPAEEPRVEHIAGDPERWGAFIAHAGGLA